jgi:ribosomal protein L29
MAEKKATKTAPKKTATTAKVVKSGFASAKDLREKSVKDLAARLVEVQKDLADARRGLVAGELMNPRVIGNYKKEIARLKTIMVEKARADQGKEDA